MITHIIAKTVLLHDDKILIVRRSKTDTRRPLQWDLPGGMVEEGEDPNLAAAREIEEEAGIIVDPRHMDLVFAGTKVYNKNANIVRLFYVAKADTNEVKLSFEHDDSRWLTLDEAIEMPDGYETHQELFRHIRDNQLIADLPL